MLFRRKIEPQCVYCEHARQIEDDKVVCKKRGVSGAYDKCRAFKYDPLKRVPPSPGVLKTKDIRAEDFEL